MNSKTATVVVAAVIFTLVGTLVFAAVVPYLSEIDAQGPPRIKLCNPNSPNGGATPPPCGGIRK